MVSMPVESINKALCLDDVKHFSIFYSKADQFTLTIISFKVLIEF